jgi:hypothetical protein
MYPNDQDDKDFSPGVKANWDLWVAIIVIGATVLWYFNQ